MSQLDCAGRFKCRVMDTANWFGESGEKKTPFIAIPIEVIDGPETGNRITSFHYLSENAFENTIGRLAEVFGFNGNLQALACNEITFSGLECEIETEIEEYNGKQRCRVKWLNPVGYGGLKPMESAALDRLLARLGPKAKAIAAAKGKTAPMPTAPPRQQAQAQAAKAQPLENDDLPF